MPKRRLIGTIISNKMPQTVVVRVERVKGHAKYKKRFKAHKNYKAHAPEGEFKVGEKVTIEECRPISRDKHWQIVKK